MQELIETKPRTRRTKQQILQLLNEFERAGSTIKDFCAAKNIHPVNFHKWRSRHKGTSAKKISSAFVQLQVPVTATPHMFAEVGGIKIYAPVEAAYLKALLP